MAKVMEGNSTRLKLKKKGRYSKKRSYNKKSKNYHKPYGGQGR